MRLPFCDSSTMCSFVRAFFRSFVRSFIRAFCRSFIHSSVRSFVRSTVNAATSEQFSKVPLSVAKLELFLLRYSRHHRLSCRTFREADIVRQGSLLLQLDNDAAK